MNGPIRETLEELLAKLPRQITPPQNRWPQIARGIERRPRLYRPIAIAASVIACAAGALIWALLAPPRMSGTGPVNGAGSGAVHAVSFDEPQDPAYLETRASLEKSFHERLAILDPVTRGKINASLGEIRQAHEQLRQALAQQPANVVLERLLESTLQDEFDLYDSVVQGTQPSMLRS